MNCPHCGTPLLTAERVVYKMCEDCWIKNQHLLDGKKYGTRTKRMKDEHGQLVSLDISPLNKESRKK